ncbi:hypothetical protein AvCA_26950 [Azotobacter vinelandii CA]|uniref:Uncharacterized protein n=2 Tax=Azotobacter vinelandii TaxID=354 RepID=C1DJV1_AZOVD|nr:hypothetical protein Avin_26950 [Azotobacter vinelandii DJ]AGK14876.1 hypothetical protein AvCA_26950 [Azotobacter vinelandii CA]AGK20816.1 hypothetical protein AvCA6_26950 [Azotobacter vinelandii CA6]
MPGVIPFTRLSRRISPFAVEGHNKDKMADRPIGKE